MGMKALHFAAFEVNLEIHELRKHGVRIRLSEQPFHALVLMLQSGGEVVTREELRKALWPDQNWGDLDHRLNKTINRVREALGDSAETPRFVETLPRIGYRFLVPVQPLAHEVVPPPEPGPLVLQPKQPPQHRGGWPRWPVLAAILVAAALGLPTVFRALPKKVSPPLPAYEATPLTTFLGSERYPSFSPDGRRVAFAWDGEAQKSFHIFVMSVNPGAPRQLTSGPENDYGPVWSPDGRTIAFLRESGAAGAEVRLIQADGTAERKIAALAPASTTHPLAWTRDPRWLVVAVRTPDGGPPAIFLLSTETGERRRLTSPPMQSAGDFSPAISPDGRKLAFIRATTTAAREIFVVTLSPDFSPTAQPYPVTSLRRVIDSVAWTPDSNKLYFSASPTLAGTRFLFRVNASPGAPNQGFLETGIEGSEPAISPAMLQLVYVRNNLEQTSIWRIQVAGDASAPPRWSRLMSSTRRDFTADISPDGKKLVFSSDRSGPTEIWLSNLDGSELKRLTSLGASPRWSPDGRHVAFESTAEGQSDICELDVETGATLRLTNDPASDIYPSWSRDGQFIYFSSYRTGSPQIWKVPSRGGPAVQITHCGGKYAVESLDGKAIYYTTAQEPASIRRVPVAGGEEADLIHNIVGLSAIAMAPDGLYYLSPINSKRTELDLFSFADGRRRQVAAFDHLLHHVLSSPPDGRSVVFTEIDRQDTDLMLVRVR